MSIPGKWTDCRMNGREIKALGDWLNQHADLGAACSREKELTFKLKFSPTGIGVHIEIECICGAKEDLSDYASW